MADHKPLLARLYLNLNILQEREAKYGGNVPLELINQIIDYQAAINLTERAMQGKLSDADWREAIRPLLLAIQFDRSEQDIRALREAYLNRLLERTSFLSLSGIDPKAASVQSNARLDLGSVYTALLTLSPSYPEYAGPLREVRRLSALAQLNNHPRLVLLGDPGSGKSTFIDFVTMCLAGEILGHPQANLAQLTAPLPDEEGHNVLDSQPWDHGPLLPVPIILRDFAARGLPPPGQPTTAEHLWQFIRAELKNALLNAFAKPLFEELHQHGGLLLLDGLDEVPEADQRRVQIKQAVDDFARSFKRCRIIVTSRTYAYQKQDWRLPGFTETVLAPFSEGQMRRFIGRWYSHIAELRGLHLDDAQGRAELLTQAVLTNERLRALAERPLLLTLMASLHAWRGGSLPERREELYADTVELLLDWWQSPKIVKNPQGQAVMLEPSLAEWLAVDQERVRDLLNELAYQAHHSQPELVGTADITEETLVAGLLRLSQNPDLKPARLVEYLSNRAGLLLPRGVGIYTFPHRTFQEYLAACHLTDTEYPDLVADLARQAPNRWREVALLAGAKAGRGSTFAVWALIDALCFRDTTETSQWLLDPAADGEPNYLADAWGALLAGQSLLETTHLSNISDRHLVKLQRIRQWLMFILNQGLLPAIERALAGDILARLGDTRPGIGLQANGLPDLVWCKVPAGLFIMGSDPQHDKRTLANEQPQHQVELPAFSISCYPITQGQYRAFVDSGGYQVADYWLEAQAAGYWQQGRIKRVAVRFEGGDIRTKEEWATIPAEFGSKFSLANHPVVGVNWYEALAFCRWLTDRLHQTGELAPHETITLPSESQWEKAARGPDGRIYPWGNEPDSNRANYTETGLGATSAVGCFPEGRSPYGCEDMSGNVGEWCRTRRQDYGQLDPFDDNFDGYLPRVVRGGGFNNYEPYVRCAVRIWNLPDDRDGFFGFRVVRQ